MSKGGGGDQIWTMTDKGGEGVKKINILPDVLCEWPLNEVKLKAFFLRILAAGASLEGWICQGMR